ncbi:MAG: type II toxin-antitoxin system VapC family toxin [Aeromicrobium sp.]|nr:type II toxin-antitoxin system VapC family toxin [Burkholderiales bacterium]
MFLLDTNIVSESRKPKPHGGVMAWLDAQESNALFISAMTIGELQRGVEITREQDETKAAQIESWLEQIINSGQLLPLDAAVCREWARLMHGKSDTLADDAFIAATARVNGLTVVTRNVRDFNALGVATLNPFVKVA